jgi:hypothetical protein
MSTPPIVPRSASLSHPGSGSGAPMPAGGRSNPISLRIYKALGTSFDDAGSREALEIASSFYDPSSWGIEAKGKGKADHGELRPSRLVDRDELPRRTLRTSAGMQGQGPGQTSAAALARRHLKRDVEQKLAGGSQKFLEAFGEVDKVRTFRRARDCGLMRGTGRSLMCCKNICGRCRSGVTRSRRSWTRRTMGQSTCSSELTGCGISGECAGPPSSLSTTFG